MVNGIDSLISLSYFSLLVYKNNSSYFYKTMLKWKNLNMVENHEKSWRETGQEYSKIDIHNNTTNTFV